MTRQKKEIWKKINELNMYMAVEEELGCGFTPADWFAPIEHEIYELEEQLAKLSHYNSVEDMQYDWLRRSCPEIMEGFANQ